MAKFNSLLMKTWPSISLESQFYSLLYLIKGSLEQPCAIRKYPIFSYDVDPWGLMMYCPVVFSAVANG